MCSACGMNFCSCEGLGMLSCVREANALAVASHRIGSTVGEMSRFEDYVNANTPAVGWEKYRVVMSTKIVDLTGRGEEWLMSDQGEVLCKFFDGGMVEIVFDKSDIDIDEATVITG